MSNKSKLRTKYFQIRQSLTEEELLVAEKNILSIVESNLSIFQNKRVSCYWSIGREMPTHNLIDLISRTGSELYLPKIVTGSREMKFSKLEDKSKLTKNRFGILETGRTKEISPEDLDLILLPCICFDKKGYRIGMGKGYYDYSLRNINMVSTKLILVAYDFQKIENCFPENHDVMAESCLTDSEFYKF
tara:strand:- start:289 stop:855 length:567 start_codon:yes stop_codon:yes gene_type:complete